MKIGLTREIITDLEEVDSVTFLAPFLEVIRSENTTGPITGVALSSINKILSYNLLGEWLYQKNIVLSLLIIPKIITALVH